MDTIVKRLREVARDLKIGEGTFEVSIGKSVGYLNITEKRNGDPGASLVKRTIDNYPEYSLRWIMTGQGDMKIDRLHLVNEEAAQYNKQGNTVQSALIDLIEKIVEDRVAPKIADLNDSVNILMKRGVDESKVNHQLKKES